MQIWLAHPLLEALGQLAQPRQVECLCHDSCPWSYSRWQQHWPALRCSAAGMLAGCGAAWLDAGRRACRAQPDLWPGWGCNGRVHSWHVNLRTAQVQGSGVELRIDLMPCAAAHWLHDSLSLLALRCGTPAALCNLVALPGVLRFGTASYLGQCVLYCSHHGPRRRHLPISPRHTCRAPALARRACHQPSGFCRRTGLGFRVGVQP